MPYPGSPIFFKDEIDPALFCINCTLSTYSMSQFDLSLWGIREFLFNDSAVILLSAIILRQDIYTLVIIRHIK